MPTASWQLRVNGSSTNASGFLSGSINLIRKRSPLHPQGFNHFLVVTQVSKATAEMVMVCAGISGSVNNYVNKITRSGCEK